MPLLFSLAIYLSFSLSPYQKFCDAKLRFFLHICKFPTYKMHIFALLLNMCAKITNLAQPKVVLSTNSWAYSFLSSKNGFSEGVVYCPET